MDICFEVLDNSKEALKNPKVDSENRCNPIYVSRIITAMVRISCTHGYHSTQSVTNPL